MRRVFHLILFLFALQLHSAASGNGMKYRYIYIEAVRQQDMGNYSLAFELFRRCHEMAPRAAETSFELSKLYLAAKQDSLGLVLLKGAVEQEPQNTEYAELLARMYLYRNEVDSAAAVYEGLATLQYDRPEYLHLLARIYEQQRDYSRLLSVLDRMELREGQSEEITLSKMQAYSYMGDQQGAYRELKSLVDAHPNDKNLQVMMGNWLLGNGRKEEAYATFTEVLREEPDNAQGQMSLMDFYRAEGRTQQADSLLYNMLVNPRTDPSTRVTMMRDWVKDSEEKGGDSLRIMQMFDRVLQLPQKTAEVAEMKVAYLMLKKAPKDSIKSGWESVLRITPEYVGARLELIKILWADSIDDKVIDECRKAVEYVPDEPVLYYHLGVAQYVNKRYTEAIESLRRGVANFTKETSASLSADIYVMLGDALYKEKRIEEAYAAYDSCLIYSPDNVVCLNNYAYFLSLDNRELKKAEKMSYRAITAEPNNGTYLDTYAWILYLQQRYEEARIYIDQAIKCELAEDSAAVIAGDILEHAGDIYMKLGHKEEAMDFWNRALKSGVEDEATLRRKINTLK